MRTRASVPGWLRAPPLAVRLVLVVLVVGGLGWFATAFRVPGQPIAVWWPAAGVSVGALLLARPRERPLVVAALLMGNLLGSLAPDRTGPVTVAGAVILTASSVLVVAVLHRGRPDPRRLADLADLRHLAQAVVVGGAATGLGLGLLLASTAGVDPVTSGLRLLASHASAMLVITPLAMGSGTDRSRVQPAELLGQWAVVVAVTAIVFAPGQQLPLGYLVMPLLVGAALRDRLRTVTVQLASVASVAVLLTARGGGPFASAVVGADRAYAVAVEMLQLYLVVLSFVALSVAVVVGQRRAAGQALARSEQRLRAGFHDSLLGLLLLRPTTDGLEVVERNLVAARMLGGPHRIREGSRFCEGFDEQDRARLARVVADLVTERSSGWRGRLRFGPEGHERWFDTSMAAIAPDADGVVLLSAQLLDVTARVEAESRLSDLALRDALTGLGNRVLLDDRLEHALADSRRTASPVGVIYLDLDGFKPVNDRLGHDAGDQVLTTVARRLETAVREVDTVARPGGDEFAIVCPAVGGALALQEIATRVAAALSAPIDLEGEQIVIGASIGTALSDGDVSPGALLREADIAMYERKRARTEGRSVPV